MPSLPICCLVLLIVVVPLTTSITVPSHYVTKYYTRNVLVYTLHCYSHGGWWWRHRHCYRRCSWVPRTFSYRACADGYTGTKCNIPVCSPPCQNKGVCVAVNKCDCPSRYSGGRCQTEKCSWAKDCYPGICKRSTTTCDCSAEFDGPNCQTMKEGPIFQECSARIVNEAFGRSDVYNVNCSFYGDVVKLYTNMVNITQVGMTFSPTYRKLTDLPSWPSGGYLRTFRVGLISARGEVILKDILGKEILKAPVPCISNGDWQHPQETINCNPNIKFTRGLRHRQEMEFRMFGTTGGYKDVRNQDTAGTYVNRSFTGSEGEIKAYVVFDLEAPFHCTENKAGYPCEDDFHKPIDVYEDITHNPHVNFAFAGWNDTDAGLRGYNYGVYRMRPNAEGNLQNDSIPIITKAFDLFAEVQNSSFTLPSPGLYAIIAQIHDFANNSRWARCMVLYSNENDTIQTTNEPLKVSPGPEADTVDDAFWMSDLTSPVKLTWGKHYANKFVADNKFGNQVVALHGDFLDCGSNISTEGTPNVEGIAAFSTSVVRKFQRPTTRRRREITPPNTWTPVDITNEEVILTDLASRTSGDSFTVHIKAEDMLGNIMTDYTYIRMDNTPPTVDDIEPNFIRNATRTDDTKGFFSSVDISAVDRHGGLHRIGYTVYDILDPSNPVAIKAGFQVITQSKEDSAACATSINCWCTKEDECYDTPVKLYLDNCWFVDFLNVPIQMELSVNNRARLAQNITYNLGKVSGISGVGEYPPPLGLRVQNAYGYVVVLTWYLPSSCYDIRLMNLELTGASEKSAILSAKEEEVEIKDLVPYADYTASLSITYQGNRISEPLEFSFNTGEPPVDNRSKCGTGCIIGIVIGMLILIALVVAIVLIYLRLRKKKSPLPHRMMGPVNRMSHHFGHTGWSEEDEESPPPPYPGTKGSDNMGFSELVVEKKQGQGMTLNVAYNSGPKLRDFEQDIYTYGEMETEPSAKWKHSDDRITIGRSIHKGRFAEIKEAKLQDGSGSRKVAAKMILKHSTDNDLLMKAKMNFLATVVVHHNNIVNFVGAVTEGPIILLELCDRSLKDWLNNIDKVNDEVEDNMVNFSTDVARGMRHLQELEIVHRRLGARNVLLKHVPLMGRIVGKVTGFGPMKGETSGSNVESDKERIPVKWMAIEQLGIEKGETRPYTEETDVWSYGVTVWEIFSKGDNPFSDLKSSDVRGKLDQGIRLKCPKYASEELYQDIIMPCWNRTPEKRPMFQETTNDLERMFHGAQDGDMYYDDAPMSTEQALLYDDTRP